MQVLHLFFWIIVYSFFLLEKRRKIYTYPYITPHSYLTILSILNSILTFVLNREELKKKVALYSSPQLFQSHSGTYTE